MKKISLAIGLAALGSVLAGFLWTGAAAGADIIYFKDGMRTVCQGNAWQEKDEVHCEYDGGLLIYPKNDVLQIEKGPAIHGAVESSKSQDQGLKQPSPPAADPSPPSPTLSSASPRRSSGILFYDPRRAKRYWSSATVQHDSYADALSALASEFDRPAQWIEENMGDSNDLEDIRDTLTARKQAASAVPKVSADHAAAGEIEFYNPRRPQKYWTAADARHNTYDEALAALAREFGEPPSWVELHMGDSNDIGLIRQHLKNAQQSEKGR
jgi:hypothetical protein